MTRITATARTLDVSAEGYPYPRVVDARAIDAWWRSGDVGSEILEVEVTTTTVHRVTARALAEATANAERGVRGVSALGELLKMHKAEVGFSGFAVQHTTVVGGDQADLIVSGWEFAATTAADVAVPQPGQGGIATWRAAYRAAWIAARARAGFEPTDASGYPPDEIAGAVRLLQG